MSVKSITKALGTVAAIALLAGISASAARAGNWTFQIGSGVHTAEALFVSSGNQLTVTLKNTYLGDVTKPTEVLTALFFNMGDGLSPVSATLAPGSKVYQNGSEVTGISNVGGEWAYEDGLTGAPGGATAGISSTGLSLFGQPNFNGPNLDPPAALDGLNYGITSAGDNVTTGNGDVLPTPLVKNSVVFVLTGLPTNFDQGPGITNVWFLYGTSNTGTEEFPPVPEPAFFQMAGFLSLGGLGLLKLRRRRK